MLSSKFKLNDNLYRIYFVLALPMVFTLVFLMPPFQISDEPNHFLKTTDVASGHLIPSNRVGSDIPTSIIALTTAPTFRKILFHPETKVNTVTSTVDFFQLEWNTSKKFIAFPNTIFYGFLTYLPAVTGILFAKIMGLNVLASFYMSRLFNALFAVILSAIAIKYISRGKTLAFAILAMPMTLFQFASVSQDASLISETALAIGLINLLLDSNPSKQTARFLIGFITFLLCAVSMGKFPYALLILILPTVLLGEKAYFKTSLAAALCALFITAFYMLMVKNVTQPQLATHPCVPSNIAFPSEQLHYLISNLSKIPYLLFHTLMCHGVFYFASFTGYLGWLERPFPIILYILYFWVLMGCIAIDVGYRKEKISNYSKVILILLCSSCMFVIFISLYLIWTSVGKPIIDGVQGRYFIPVILWLTLLFNRNPNDNSITILSKLDILSIIPISIITILDASTPFSIIERYYY